MSRKLVRVQGCGLCRWEATFELELPGLARGADGLAQVDGAPVAKLIETAYKIGDRARARVRLTFKTPPFGRGLSDEGQARLQLGKQDALVAVGGRVTPDQPSIQIGAPRSSGHMTH